MHDVRCRPAAAWKGCFRRIMMRFGPVRATARAPAGRCPQIRRPQPRARRRSRRPAAPRWRPGAGSPLHSSVRARLPRWHPAALPSPTLDLKGMVSPPVVMWEVCHDGPVKPSAPPCAPPPALRLAWPRHALAATQHAVLAARGEAAARGQQQILRKLAGPEIGGAPDLRPRPWRRPGRGARCGSAPRPPTPPLRSRRAAPARTCRSAHCVTQ